MPSFNPTPAHGRSTTPSLEQYIEAISYLLTKEKVCSVSEIATQVQVSRPAASRAIRELAEKRFVEHKAYGYVDLTPSGKTLADVLTARHEALYDFLVDVLRFDAEWADQEACRLEHQVDDVLVGRLSELRYFFQQHPDVASIWDDQMNQFQEQG